MAQKAAPTKAHKVEASPVARAFGEARVFVEHFEELALHARVSQLRPAKPDEWQSWGMTYAMAFVAWFKLSHLLTPAVCTEVRRVYPPGSPVIRLDRSMPYPTVIEAVNRVLGVPIRVAVYNGRNHPLEPDILRLTREAKARATARQGAQGKLAEAVNWGEDFHELFEKETLDVVLTRLGIETVADAWKFIENEWKKLDREQGERALECLRCESVDFCELKIQLQREADAVIATMSKPSAPVIDPFLLKRVEAAAVAIPAVLEGNRAGFERVAGVIESLHAREVDDATRAKLPNLKPHDRQAWQLATLHGMTQGKVAAALNKEHGTTYTQGQVSRMIARVKSHADKNGLAEKVAGPIDRPRTVDPRRLELGARVDQRKPRPSDMARVNDDDDE